MDGVDWSGKRAVVMGLGSFSGGVAAARFLARRAARVIVSDSAGPEQLTESLAALAGEPIEAFHLGGHDAADFRRADLVVVSPAVRGDHPLVAAARAAGARITTEMNLFFEHCAAAIVGVTGSNGKSTTAAMIHAMLEAAGRSSWLGGNIGRSLLDRVAEIRPGDAVVLELSSFQLEQLDAIARSPHTAVVTTFTPNHLDRHATLDAYRCAKQALLRHQAAGDCAVLNADDAEVRTWPARGRAVCYGIADHGRDGAFLDGDRLLFRDGTRVMDAGSVEPLRLPGRHNRSNAVGAAAAAVVLGCGPEAVCRALASFRTLPHRIECVAEIDGRRFFDDSIATTPESTLAALESLEGPIWLIAGGHDKGLDLAEVARRIAERVEGAALLGQTAAVLEQRIAQCARPGRAIPIGRCASMPEAVRWCFERSKRGDAIVLSPACASFGMFRNFVERAEVFRRAVWELGTAPGSRAAKPAA